MSDSISIRVKEAEGKYDLGKSKFFGTPTVPGDWVDDFYEDEIFFCQIRLADIAELDPEARLPQEGYLYIFLHTDGTLSPDVRYYGGEPDNALDGFNADVDGFEQYTKEYLMDFAPADEDAEGTRLFGIPSDWQYGEEPPRLLLQYDPLDAPMGFLDSRDGYLYFFFGEDGADLDGVTLLEEFS